MHYSMKTAINLEKSCSVALLVYNVPLKRVIYSLNMVGQENATLLCMKWVLKGFLFQGILHSLFARNVLLFLKKYCKKWCYASTLLSEYTVPHPFKDFFETQTFPSTTASIEESSLLWHFTKNKCFMLIFHMFSLMCSLLSFKHGRLPNSNW